MATPYADPRTGILYFKRDVPEKLRAAVGGKGVIKVSLRTCDPAEAKAAFARENALFEQQMADARRRIAEGVVLTTPAALVRRWCETPALAGGLSGPQRLAVNLMELDAAVGARGSAGPDELYPPAVMGPAANTDWDAVLADHERLKALIPIHARLIALGFLDYCDALAKIGHTQLFPHLLENSVGKRTKEASHPMA
jgi:hypothetical protein